MSLYLQCDNCGRLRWIDILFTPDGWTGGVAGVAGRLPPHRCDTCNQAGEEAREAALSARHGIEVDKAPLLPVPEVTA